MRTIILARRFALQSSLAILESGDGHRYARGSSAMNSLESCAPIVFVAIAAAYKNYIYLQRLLMFPNAEQSTVAEFVEELY